MMVSNSFFAPGGGVIFRYKLAVRDSLRVDLLFQVAQQAMIAIGLGQPDAKTPIFAAENAMFGHAGEGRCG